MQNLPPEIQDTKDYLYLCTILYENLAQQTPSQYNIERATEYCDRLTDKYGNEEKTEDLRTRLERIRQRAEGKE